MSDQYAERIYTGEELRALPLRNLLRVISYLKGWRVVKKASKFFITLDPDGAQVPGDYSDQGDFYENDAWLAAPDWVRDTSSSLRLVDGLNWQLRAMNGNRVYAQIEIGQPAYPQYKAYASWGDEKYPFRPLCEAWVLWAQEWGKG